MRCYHLYNVLIRNHDMRNRPFEDLVIPEHGVYVSEENKGE